MAIDWKTFAGENPAARIKMFKEHKRERFLSPDELQRVNDALLQEPDPYWRAYFPLVCMLGTRRSELLAAKWTDVDLEQRTWRLPMTKAGRSHLLPLPAPAVAILEALPSRESRNGSSPGVAPAAISSSPRRLGNGYATAPVYRTSASMTCGARLAVGSQRPATACR